MGNRLAALLLITLSVSASVSCRQLRCPDCRQLQAQDGVVYVANASDPAAAGINITVPTVRLVDALRDPRVRTIILLTNYTAAEFADHTNGPKVKLQRNVTLMAPPGLMPLLDVQFKRSQVHLCATCQAHLRYIVIANERRGNGAGVDFFVGDPGSSLKLEDSYRLRLACTSTNSTLELINREQFRSPHFPLPGGNSTQRQVLARNSVAFLGHNYTDMVKLVDFAYDVPVSFVEGQGLVGGFTMRTVNTTRLCATTVSQQCLKVKAADACVNEAIDNLLADRSKQTSATAQQQAAASGGPSSPLLVAIVVPIAVVAGLLLTAGVILWAMCARHRRRQQHQLSGKASSCSKSQSQPSEPGGAGSSRHLADRASPSSSCAERGDTEEGGADPFVVGDLGEPRADQGWEVVAANTRPSLGAVGNATIHWGRLLGAGSFGRVYKGRWAGLEAAIKCIEHDSESSKAVENEVQLMLSLDHPNVVKAYYYITYRHTVVQSSKWLPNQSVPLPQISIPASPLSGASRGRQQREQKKQLQTLERQLQLDLGTKHQWLLDMHLGCTGQLSSNGSLQHSSCSSNGSVPATGVSSSPAVASTVLLSGASGQLSPHSIGVDSQSQMMGLTNTECADSTCSGSSALQQQLQGVQQQQQPNHEDWALPDSPPPVQVVLPPLDRQDPDEEEQDTPSSEQPGQALPPSALLQQQQGPLQHRDGSSTAAVAAADVRISLPDSPESTGGSLANSTQELEGSAGSYPSTGQPLTPNQRVGLQRYLMRQHQLIQTSGMRVRSASAPLPPPVPVAGVAVKAQDVGGAPGNGNDTTGMSDTPDTSGRSPRRPQELSRCRTYIVQEFCDLGTFTSYASKVLTDPCEEQQMLQLLVLLQDAARGIAALHSKSVVHGDVNARNVLVASSSTAPYGAVAKLADLGLSRVIRQQATHKTTNSVGTLSHMPPEMLRYGRMSSAVDMYSYGIMMWEAFTGQPAFRHLHYGQFFECIVLNDMRPNVPEDMPRDYSMLMLACWSTNPADRPTADRVLEVLQLMVQERQAVLAEAQHHGVWLQGEGQRDDTAVHPHPASEGSHAQGAHSAESAGSSGQGRGVGGGAGCRAPAGPGGLGVQGPLDGSSSGGSSLLLPV